MMTNTKRQQRTRRHARIRAKVHGTSQRPRLSVFRSNQHVYAQLVDDARGKVLVSASDLKIKGKGTGKERAKAVGKALSKAAKEKGVSAVVFDRSGYKYHGAVRQVAEGAREEGLQF